jgi:hypothetical protein
LEKSVWARRTIELGDEVCEVQRAHQREVAWILLSQEAGLLVLRCSVSVLDPTVFLAAL